MSQKQKNTRVINGIPFTLTELSCPGQRMFQAKAETVMGEATVERAVAELEDEGYVVGVDVSYTIWASRIVKE